MEQVLRILRQLMGAGGMLGNIPKPIRISILFFTVFVTVVIIFKFANLDQGTKVFLIIAIVLLAIITGAYYGWQAYKKKQQNQQIVGDIVQHSSATPRGISDPNARARLDDLRKKFQSGIDAYKSRGKSLYSLPWYMMVGEPGSGKTEVIRHSNVGFPPGMQDEYKGVGGTINMDWWFTNKAVVLDTAGRLMFEEVQAGQANEWQQFLSLLKKNRPNEPINGLFLAIPADSLIKDSADAIEKKAKKIAQQLDLIQRTVDVRFPVFIVITKCDIINGFREFFDAVTDPQLQHQMLGWSNPDPLDEPFKAEKVDLHLKQVAERLRRRRLKLMLDPVPENPDARRTDELDSFYAFPHNLELLSSRLRRYLETIFISGEWSLPPLFLRGIYFSSSLREGSALDADLAEALGVGVDDLPESKVWERERAFFLRDMFVEKAFREKGLVTRATNTSTMLRTQKLLLYGLGFAGLVTLTALAWFAMGNLRASVKDQGDVWKTVMDVGWGTDYRGSNYWKQPLVPLRGDGSYDSAISTNTVSVNNKQLTLGEFHARLRDVSEKPLKRNILFPTLASTYNRDSHRAQRIVFETGVVRPLIEGARQKMQRDALAPGFPPYQPDVLEALIRLESDLLSRGAGPNTGILTLDGARTVLTNFQDYIAGKLVPADTNLVAVMARTYSSCDSKTGAGCWPPNWLGGSHGETNTLAANSGISSGLELFIRDATNGVDAGARDLSQIEDLRHAAGNFSTAEAKLFGAAQDSDNAAFHAAMKEVADSKSALDAAYKQAAAQSLFTSGVSLAGAQMSFSNRLAASAGGALERIQKVNQASLEAHPGYQLFVDIRSRLATVQESVFSKARDLMSRVGSLAEFQLTDENLLNGKAFATRADLYSRADSLSADKAFADGGLVGDKCGKLQKFIDEKIGPVRAETAGYQGRLAKEFTNTIAYELRRADAAQSASFFSSYLGEAVGDLAMSSGFPLIAGTSLKIDLGKFGEATNRLEAITADLGEPCFKKFLAGQKSEQWERFVQSVSSQQKLARALHGVCTVSLSDVTDDQWRDVKMVCGSLSGDDVRVGSGDQKLGDARLDQKIQFVLSRNINLGTSQTPSTLSVPTGDWGPIWLIHTYKSQRDEVDPKTWLVEVKYPGINGVLRLKLKFENELPELKNWPTLPQ